MDTFQKFSSAARGKSKNRRNGQAGNPSKECHSRCDGKKRREQEKIKRKHTHTHPSTHLQTNVAGERLLVIIVCRLLPFTSLSLSDPILQAATASCPADGRTLTFASSSWQDVQVCSSRRFPSPNSQRAYLFLCIFCLKSKNTQLLPFSDTA